MDKSVPRVTVWQRPLGHICPSVPHTHICQILIFIWVERRANSLLDWTCIFISAGLLLNSPGAKDETLIYFVAAF